MRAFIILTALVSAATAAPFSTSAASEMASDVANHVKAKAAAVGYLGNAAGEAAGEAVAAVQAEAESAGGMASLAANTKMDALAALRGQFEAAVAKVDVDGMVEQVEDGFEVAKEVVVDFANDPTPTFEAAKAVRKCTRELHII